MGGELSKIPGNDLAAVLSGKEIGEIIRPLTREIHLFDTFVAGTSHLTEKKVLEKIREGDKLTLRREENKFDENAILILTEGNEKVGYVPEKDNIVFSRLMDAGKLLIARITRITPCTGYTQIAIGIYLVDF
jgi:hypothetical protein